MILYAAILPDQRDYGGYGEKDVRRTPQMQRIIKGDRNEITNLPTNPRSLGKSEKRETLASGKWI